MQKELLIDEPKKVMQKASDLFVNDLVLEEALKEFVPDETVEKIKESVSVYAFITGYVASIETRKEKITVVVDRGVGGFKEAKFEFPPNDRMFLTEFVRAQNHNFKVMVVFWKKEIKSVKLISS